jgi:lipid A ethanolaminephosphotransferase
MRFSFVFGKAKLWLTSVQMNIIAFCVLYAIAGLVLFHISLFSFAIDHLAQTQALLSSRVSILSQLVLLIFFPTFLWLMLVSLISQRLVKPVAILLWVGSAIAYYFMSQYQVILDRTMMGNVFNTDTREVSELLTLKFFGYVLLCGGGPALIFSFVHIKRVSFWKRLGALLLALFLALGFTYVNGKTWLWFDQNAKKIGGMLLPSSYLINTGRYYSDVWARGRTQTFLPPLSINQKDNVLVILVIGESARRDHFSLYGYSKLTNPLLSQDKVMVLPNTTACATYTTEAVGCILSHLGSQTPTTTLYEPLPSYLFRHQVKVLWASNNWGEPPVKVSQYVKAQEIRQQCKAADCRELENDGALLYQLNTWITPSITENTFVVLHQIGSHGPAYDTRYLPEYEIFKPVCHSVDLQQCSRDALVNAYDNTILNTDHFLHQIILKLRALKGVPSVLIYLSDHGESLGESGVYLHGLPYSIAPAAQKEIPLLIWMSDTFKQKRGWSDSAFQKQWLSSDPQKAFSQDVVFHSVLGAFGVNSSASSLVYKPEFNLFHHE